LEKRKLGKENQYLCGPRVPPTAPGAAYYNSFKAARKQTKEASSYANHGGRQQHPSKRDNNPSKTPYFLLEKRKQDKENQ